MAEPQYNRRDDRGGLRFLVTAACLVIVIAGLRAGATVLVPFALALFLAVLSLPLILLLRRFRIPAFLAILFTLLVNVAIISVFVMIITRSVTELVAAMPRYAEQFEALAVESVAWLQGWGIPVSAAVITDMIDPARVIDLVTGALRGIAAVLTSAFLVLLIMIFILGEATVFPKKLRIILGSEDADISRYSKIITEVQNYLTIKTLVSLATGTTVGVSMWLVGLDFPVLWGLLAFLFNYIPNVGSILAAIPAVLLALIQLGFGSALLVAGIYAGVNVVFGNLVEPNLLGRRLGLSTLVVVLSLVFWGWVWGPIGMLLSVPLTMIVKIMLENSREFRWVAVLLAGSKSDDLLTPPEDPLLREVPEEQPL